MFIPAAVKSFGLIIILLLKSLYLTVNVVDIDEGFTVKSISSSFNNPWLLPVDTVTKFLATSAVIGL